MIPIKENRFYIFIFAILLICVLFLVPKYRQPSVVQIKEVIEANVIRLNDGRTLRLIGVRCPSIRHRISEKWFNSEEELSLEAKKFTEKLIEGKQIRLEFDVLQQDHYGDLLAYIFVKDDGKELFLNKEIIRNGFGYYLVSFPNTKYLDDLAASQKEAFQLKRGIWEKDDVVSSEEAKNFIGQRKYVQGKIIIVKDSYEAVFLLFHKWKKSYLKVVIPKKYLQYFNERNIDPFRFYLNRNVRIFGLIEEYSGPEISISHPAQIEIIE